MPSIKLAILGCGGMGTAILRGLLQDRQTWELWACVRSEASVERIKKEAGENASFVRITHENKDLESAAQWADVVLLGPAPKDLDKMLATISPAKGLEEKLFVSMLAGVSILQITTKLEKERIGSAAKAAPVARIIPSIAAAVGQSATLLAKEEDPGNALSPRHQEFLGKLLDSMGSTIFVPEPSMDTATAVGAACNALMMHAVDAITDAGVADGMSRNMAAQLASQNLASASFLMTAKGGGLTPEQLKAAMSTPGGITINSYLKLHQGQVPHGISNATREAIAYANSM